MLKPILSKVNKELDKFPMVKYSISEQIKEDMETVRLLELKPDTVFIEDLLTSTSSSKIQKEVMKKLIEDYGVKVLEKCFVEIFLKTDRSNWSDLV